MKDIFNKVMDIIDGFPPLLQLFALLVIVFLIPLYKIFSSKKMQTIILKRLQKKVGHLTENDLKLNKLFIKKESYKTIINNTRFDSPVKTKVFKIILHAKLDIDLKLSTEFIDNEHIEKIDQNLLCTGMISQVNKMVVEYERKVLDKLCITYGREKGDQLFDLVMNSPGGWRAKRIDRINRIIYQFDEYLRNSQIFDNNIERLEFFLSEIQYSLRISILEAEKLFKSLNGEFDSIIKPQKDGRKENQHTNN